MFFSKRKSGSRSHVKTSRTHSRPKFVASVERVEDRMLMTGTTAVSWVNASGSHTEVFALGFDNSVSVSKDGGSFVSEGGYSKAISAGLDWGGNPEVFAIGADNGLWVNDNGTGWVNRGGWVKAIAATSDNTVFVIGSDNAVDMNYGGAWSWLGKNVTAISAGTDNYGLPEVYAIDSNHAAWSNDFGMGWSNRSGWVKAIAGSTNNTVFAIGGDNALYMNRGGTILWSDLGGTLTAISGGSDGFGYPEAFGIGSDHAIYSNDNGWGYSDLGGYATDLAATGMGTVYSRSIDVDYIYMSRYSGPLTFDQVVPLANPQAASTYSPAGTTTLFSNGQPSYLDMNQGAVGDCWLDASLAEVAIRAPQDIKNMVFSDGTTTDNGSSVGLYSVRFFSDSGTPFYVEVDTALPSGGGYYNRVTTALGSTSLWTALFEKAYAEANTLGLVTTNAPDQGSYAALDGGNLAWALHAITGNPATSYAINPTDMASAWNSGELVVMCTTGKTPTSSAIVGSHCYAMVGYNAASSLPFEIFNPWGTQANGYAPGSTTYYGLFCADAVFMAQNFTGQTYGGGSINPDEIDPTAAGTTDGVPIHDLGTKKGIKHPGTSIPPIRPIVGSPIVGGPLA